MHNFSIMIYKVVDIINTNVILRSSMPFLQDFKVFIIYLNVMDSCHVNQCLYTSIGCIVYTQIF